MSTWQKHQVKWSSLPICHLDAADYLYENWRWHNNHNCKDQHDRVSFISITSLLWYSRQRGKLEQASTHVRKTISYCASGGERSMQLQLRILIESWSKDLINSKYCEAISRNGGIRAVEPNKYGNDVLVVAPITTDDARKEENLLWQRRKVYHPSWAVVLRPKSGISYSPSPGSHSTFPGDNTSNHQLRGD
jgi:hypothetical protein